MACAARCAEHWAKAGARERAATIQLRGLGHKLEKNYPAAIAAYKESLAFCRAIASEESEEVSSVLNNSVSEVQRLQGDFAAAERDYKEALRIAKKVENREGIAAITGKLASLALDREDWPQAEKLAQQAFDMAEKLKKHSMIGVNCLRLVQSLARQGKAAESLDYARCAGDIFSRLRQSDELEKAQAALRECGG